MTKQTTHHPHTFVANMFGVFGYVATVFVWLLVLDLIIILTSLSGAVQDFSSSINSLTFGDATSSTTAAVSGAPDTHTALNFLLGIILIVLVWVFCYMTAKVASGTLRHVLQLFGRKPTIELLSTAKYMVLAMGLIGLIVLLQFVQPLFANLKLPIAFLGLVGGIVGVGSIWTQRLLAHRHRLAISRVL